MTMAYQQSTSLDDSISLLSAFSFSSFGPLLLYTPSSDPPFKHPVQRKPCYRPLTHVPHKNSFCMGFYLRSLESPRSFDHMLLYGFRNSTHSTDTLFISLTPDIAKY
ncbi:hypothetical protein DSO57_1004793 [Entomophthora muscae]|uniref:Uncharacterized protein n=2 Tax=Entomophthora muscae TaxID=34485 RepID=A0ACC2UDR9_9FUNG|nr:hypothetical protein DSO57_1021718 [Entomophthora muscae]KAJ9090215.1 hypothetical protein DSO57_1004793 [Entomophthora muscae]